MLKTERAKHNFLTRAFSDEKYGKSIGERLYPYRSTFMQMAVDDLAAEMTNAYIEELREKERRKR